MALIVLLAVPMASITNRVRSLRRAVDAITRAGGSVFYDYQKVPSGQWDPALNNPAPRWLLYCLPRECFQDVTLINLGELIHAKTSDQQLAQIDGLRKVEYLDLSGSEATDAGLAHLRAYKTLKHLYLQNTDITDNGLAQIGGLSELRDLSLDGTQVSDAGLAHLKSLDKLSYVGLKGTRVTKVGVAELQRSLPSLKEVGHSAP
jgi:Leucine-rich repeat (LRR) protein